MLNKIKLTGSKIYRLVGFSRRPGFSASATISGQRFTLWHLLTGATPAVCRKAAIICGFLILLLFIFSCITISPKEEELPKEEPKEEEPKKEEPKEDEPTKDKPTKDKPTRDEPIGDKKDEPKKVEFTLTSSASDDGFDPGQAIPGEFKHTLGGQCSGDNNFPKLSWSGVPDGTTGFVLIVDDPDGGDWVHLNLYNIAPDTTEIPKQTGSAGAITSFDSITATLGKNSWDNKAWEGPCPPLGTHTYYFKLYAMSEDITTLNKKRDRAKFELDFSEASIPCGPAQASASDKILACSEISGTSSP